MKYSPEHGSELRLGAHAADMLDGLRERRNFDPENYLAAKADRLNEYMTEAGLKSCVVAMSGGIDSALVLGIVTDAACQKGSPIEAIYPVAEPVYRDQFTKNQDTAVERARAVCDAFNHKLIEVDLTPAYDAMKQAVDEALGVEGRPWAAGQLVSYLRTPSIYYTTSLTTQEGHGGIVVGTTNRDEGAYLGYVGKASDGIVDVQLISDLHKSEVRALSEYLGVPPCVLEAAPTGDMYDGREDETVFGASYDHVELLLSLKSLDEREAAALVASLRPSERPAFDAAMANLEELHRYNAHKYGVGSPAAHLDVMESGVPGGWPYARQKVERQPRGAENFVNHFALSANTQDEIYRQITVRDRAQAETICLPKGEAQLLHQTVAPSVIEAALADADEHGWIPVGLDGIAKNYQPGDEIGSYRASTFSPELSDYLWSRVAPHLDNPRRMGDDPQVDVEPGSRWRPIGVSPLMRFIRYDSSGLLVPHYDAPFRYDEDKMTLKSLVVYAEAQGIAGGGTRFLHDDRLADLVAERDMSDRTTLATEADVIRRIDPTVGSILLFDHRIEHDGEPVTATQPGGRKVIIRTDVEYERC